LGAGFGLLSISPWSNSGVSARTVDTAAIAWLVLIQIVASGLGGYIAGRLRTKWAAIHTDEVYFRDTAHGFLVWAVAVVLTAAFLGSAATALVGGAARTAGPQSAYFADSLLRSATSTNATRSADSGPDFVRGETASILANAVTEGDNNAADRTYLAQLVSARTGLSQTEAEQRVSSAIDQARQAADAVRRATARLLLWTFLALLIGAFCASYAATIGGRQRDNLKAV